jgi:small subunit ribosomal protein S9
MSDVNESIDVSDAPATPAPAPEPEVTEAPLTPDMGALPAFVWGTGRRKSSVARVRITPGSGNVRIKRSGNDLRELNDYFQNERDRKAIFGPLEATQYGGKLDIQVNSSGGGSTGQAEAIVMGLARAILKFDPNAEPALREGGFLTRDSRMKERKKYGQRGARRRFQFSKR